MHENYGGTRFSDWLGHASCNIVSVHIRNCKYCQSLPPFGQLPALKNLSIEGLEEVVTWYRVLWDCWFWKQAVASLQTLRFKNMLQLQEWVPFRDDGEGVVPFSYVARTRTRTRTQTRHGHGHENTTIFEK